eukprot:2528017-Prymnesium_polylepis.1
MGRAAASGGFPSLCAFCAGRLVGMALRGGGVDAAASGTLGGVSKTGGSETRETRRTRSAAAIDSRRDARRSDGSAPHSKPPYSMSSSAFLRAATRRDTQAFGIRAGGRGADE